MPSIVVGHTGRRYVLDEHSKTLLASGVGPIASDQEDLVYAIDLGNHRVEAFTKGGTFLFDWGRFGTGPGEFDFSSSCGITVDANRHVCVVEAANHRMQKFATRFTPVARTSWGRLKAIYR